MLPQGPFCALFHSIQTHNVLTVSCHRNTLFFKLLINMVDCEFTIYFQDQIMNHRMVISCNLCRNEEDWYWWCFISVGLWCEMAEAQLNYAFGQTDTLLEALAQPPTTSVSTYEKHFKVCLFALSWRTLITISEVERYPFFRSTASL
jgi:hypothetical protein